MAKIDLKFLDVISCDDYIKAEVSNQIISDENKCVDVIRIKGEEDGYPFEILLDKSTAIKFAKTLRTEINKIQ